MKPGQVEPKYRLLPSGEFVIENYNQAAPFSSFLPGVAGLKGIPLWCFYVNRGQAVASFGTKSKDQSILEFYPANKAYQFTPLQGFRTFIKLRHADKAHEPFQSWSLTHGEGVSQEMRVTSCDLSLRETNESLGLETAVHYFTIPNEPFAALARVVTIKNMGKQEQQLDVLDGLPAVVPYGMNNWILKHMSRTGEAWVGVTNLEEKGVPYFKLKVEVSDTPQVIPIHEGHFYLNFYACGGTTKISKVVIDPSLLFGQATDFSWPQLFYADDSFQVPERQVIDNKMPCSFGLAHLQLKPGESASLYTLMGHIRGEERLNALLDRLVDPVYFERKGEENRGVIEGIQKNIETRSASAAFDHYCKQSYLDNALRGGLPFPVKTEKEPFVFHVYWRKHGDLERDYNHFEVLPTYYAQGNANYRDVNQNRRMDPWFCPEVGDTNLVTFINMLQLDGYNPLVLKSVKFHLRDGAKTEKALEKYFGKKELKTVLEILKKPRTPGEFLMALEEKKIAWSHSEEEMLGCVLGHSDRIQEIDPGEGYWVDHWHYNVDLLESYLGLFPEKWGELLTGKNQFSFYDSPISVRPRREKVVLDHGKVRQFHSIFHDKEKEEVLKHQIKDPGKVRTQNGEVYHTTLLVKLFVLLVNKLATLDPFGVGVEMEADRPNWYDALNGLPGLFGSSVSETFELKRLIGFLQTAMEKAKLGAASQARFPEEFYHFYEAVEKEFGSKEFVYWDRTATAKEEYREKIRRGLHGNEKAVTVGRLQEFLAKAAKKVERGLAKAWSEKENAPVSYLINEAADWKELKTKTPDGKFDCVEVKKFKQHPLPLFLEGVVHALRTETDPAKARALYEAVRRSDLFDPKLGMYKVNASIQNETVELGRTRIFSPGWLENASIFMHMEFKYLLELLRSGLVGEFYADLKKALPAFMDPSVYGRSLLENSTFIASSANPDARVHGRGFVARLSGTNAEWLQIWNWLTVGKNPFRLNEKGELEFAPQPLLPGWLFTEKEKTFSFYFLGKVEFTYLNPSRKDLFGNGAVQPKKWTLEDRAGKKITESGSSVSGGLAEKIRSGEIAKITVELG